jgi:signal transduction histidine kinase
LDLLGLNAAIKWQAEEFSKQYQIACSVDLPKIEVQLPEGTSIILFRMLQDALKNVADHAQASNVHICIRVDAEYMELQIEDDGKGISEEQMNNLSSTGFVLMKERALSIGGNVEISGSKGKGMAVLIRIPVAR